jgi:cell division protein FtsI (penicillin-binding protein 3)
MVSTIANGGVYMPPHVLLQSTDEMKGDARLQPAAFHPSNQLPGTLPDGAHRVITELTSAKMRMMMEGTVVEGTGKEAALNGYSSGGKTGTAQKIDPATHTYSHTKLVASFAGFAPVSNPAIAVTVVIDTPTVGASKYGGAVSAPVFAQVAQQVLEYLGVPHDRPLKPQKQTHIADAKDLIDDSPNENTGDLEAMFADVNNLPADDPLRAAATQTNDAAQSPAPVATNMAASSSVKNSVMQLLPKKVADAFRANGGSNSTGADTSSTTAALVAPKIAPEAEARSNGTVVVDSVKRVAVPSFEGAALRTVVEQAERVGLRVQPLGSGLARQQVPVAGTMVPEGTQIAVRFSR